MANQLKIDNNLLDYSTEAVKQIKEWRDMPKPYLNQGFRRHTTSGESHLLYSIAKDLGPGNYADLGTLLGGSAVTVGTALNDFSEKSCLYSIDLFDLYWTAEKNVARAVPDRLKAHFNEKIKNVTLKLFKEDTSTVGNRLTTSFNFVFIDADHSYVACKKDWEAWSKLVKVGGMVAFHDCNILDVDQVMKEIDLNKWECIKQIYSIKVFKRKI